MQSVQGADTHRLLQVTCIRSLLTQLVHSRLLLIALLLVHGRFFVQALAGARLDLQLLLRR